MGAFTGCKRSWVVMSEDCSTGEWGGALGDSRGASMGGEVGKEDIADGSCVSRGCLRGPFAGDKRAESPDLRSIQ